MDFSNPDVAVVAECAALVRAHPCEFGPDFAQWIAENFVIWRAFEREALRVAERRPHYSAKTILEVIRHHTQLAERGGEFKINNNVCPDLARLFAILHPAREELFEYRRRSNTASLAHRAAA